MPKTDSVLDTKLMRLMQIREQLAEYKEWKHPAPDEVDHILYLMTEWHQVAHLKLTKDELAFHAKTSVFPYLIRFCQAELLRTVKYCEDRRAAGLGTLSANTITMVRELATARDLDTVNAAYPFVDGISITGILGRVLRVSYQAMQDPAVLTEIELLKLRGDILEVVASTYADIIEAMKEQAAKRVDAEIKHVNRSKSGARASQKLTDNELALMENRAVELRTAHQDWSKSHIARQLNKEFPQVSQRTISRYPFVK